VGGRAGGVDVGQDLVQEGGLVCHAGEYCAERKGKEGLLF